MSKSTTLLLIDGSSYLYRAFHALPELSNSKGAQTGAIFGVLNMLHRILEDLNPDLVAVVMDAPGKTFRDKLYAEYKANRPPMPKELIEQIGPLEKSIKALGLPLLSIKGVEADDVIGTLASQAEENEINTIISTGDKDMAQLVNDHISLLDTMPRGGSREPSAMDAEGVVRKFSVRADQIIDYLALVGDSSDNIPGVPKVGAKTAIALLAAFPDVKSILANIESIADLKIRGAKSISQSILKYQEQLLLSYTLATIKCDLDLPIEVEKLKRSKVDKKALSEIYQELELRSLLKKLASKNEIDAKPEVSTTKLEKKNRYETILKAAQLSNWLEKIDSQDLVAFDTETTSLSYLDAEIVGISLAVAPGDACYIPLKHIYPGAPQQLNRKLVLSKLKHWLEDKNQKKVGHNLKYDAHVLTNYGITLRGISFDTMIESYILDSTATRHDMDSVAKKYLGIETIHYEDVAGKGVKAIGFDEVEINKASDYAAEDADVTLQIHQKLWGKIKKIKTLKHLYLNIEQPLVKILQRVEANGVLVDADQLKIQSKGLEKKLTKLENEAYMEAGQEFNLSSPKQMQQILFEKLGLPILRKTPKGQPSTAEDVLQELAVDYDLPQLILEHRRLSKLKSTYTDKLPKQISQKTGRIHTSYHQAVTATGRLSSTKPNLQNIPIRSEEGRKIRQAFIAKKNYSLLAADYSQIELRIMAHISEDKGLLKAFADDQDIHRATAAEVFEVKLDKVSNEQRRSAKAINFGLIYGMSPFGLAKQLHITRGEAASYVDLYFDRYPGVHSYMEETREIAKTQNFVETVFGRRLYLPDINAKQATRRQYAERSAINAPMQGTAADIIKMAMLNVDEWLSNTDIDAKIIMQVHDELVLEVKDDQIKLVTEKVSNLMRNAAKLKVPLKVSTGIGKDWDKAH
ncbi:MAG: DNA polymerase I [Pseudomonadota bacterium]|nr:DNA polymerase I [Pseudomonadota bacterium]